MKYYNLGAMRKISDIVGQMLLENEIAYSALTAGHLNQSAYAASIRKDVEEKAMKPVKPGSIVIALSRLKKTLKGKPALVPEVIVDDIAAQSGLMEIVYERTKENLAALDRLSAAVQHASDIFMVTRGIGEITIIAPHAMRAAILKTFHHRKPKAELQGLASLTVRFDEMYIEIPNTFYAVQRRFAMKRMNIIEMISTYTEITLIFRKEDLDQAFLILHGMLGHGP